jgi:hypothetical protein
MASMQLNAKATEPAASIEGREQLADSILVFQAA